MELLTNLYHQLETDRTEWVERGVRNAVLTIPTVFPREGVSRHRLPQNFQSIGAKGVNMLTSKLMLTLFPPTMPFMRLVVTEQDRARLEQSEGLEGVAALDQELNRIEKQALSKFDKSGWRPAIAEAMRLLVVTGNALIYDRPGGLPAAYSLHNYAVARDDDGTLQAVILKQGLSREGALMQLGEEAVAAIDKIQRDKTGSQRMLESFSVFTGAIRTEKGDFEFREEVEGLPVSDPVTLKPEDLPLIPLRFAAEPQCSYGRSYVEDYDGHLLSLERLSRSITESALSMAKTIWAVRPNSIMKPQVLAKTPNLGIVAGDPADVGVIRTDKGYDMNFAMAQRDRIVAELQGSFLLNSSIQRSGERVTAEEIRIMAQELEDALGGVYTSLADTVQAPIVFYLFRKMKREREITLPKEVEPAIATGLDAISRNHMVGRIAQMFGTMMQIVGPDRVSEIINVRNVATDLATGYNLDAARYVLTEEELAQQQEEQMRAMMAQQAVGPAIDASIQQQAQ